MKNEMNEMGLSAEQRTHALLCAYVLGELEGEERAEIEKLLGESEALRAEKSKLEATIGVVADALQTGAGDALSAEATAKLESVIARRARPVWYRSNALRAAAAIAVVAGGALVLHQATQQDVRTMLDSERGVTTARADAPAERAAQTRDANERGREMAADDGQPVSADAAAPTAPAEAPAVQLDAVEAAKEVAQQPAAESTPGLAKGEREVRGSDLERFGDEAPVMTQSVQDEKRQDAEKLRFQDAEKKIAELQGQLAAGAKDARDQEVDVLTESEVAHAPQTEGKETNIYYVAPTQPEPTAGGTSLGVGAPGSGGGSTVSSRRMASGRKAGGNNPAGPSTSGPGAVPGPATPGGAGGLAGGPSGKPLPAPAKGDAFGREWARGFDNSDPAEGGETVGRVEELHDLPESVDKAKSGEVTGADLDDATKNRFEEQRKLGYVSGEDEYFLGQGVKRDDLSRRAEALRRYHVLEQSCRIRPAERPRDMFFRFWGDNPFEIAALDKLSTFSADVDTASYALARNYLVRGYLPTKEQIRTEEFINYFKGDVPPPTEGAFNVALELAPSLFGDSSDTWMLRVALRGKEIAKEQRMPLTLIFVVDVSGSMREENRLELVKHALRLLSSQLDARDTIAIVTFSDNASLVLPPTSAKQKDLIESAIHPLTPQNSTNTEAGLRMGYAQAAAALTQGANNRVVLLTDGVANVGLTDPNALVAMVETQRKQGILLNTVGVGMDNHNDNLLEQLADKGDGLCNYVDDEQEVRRALVDNFTGALIPIARDVKIQVEFDPAQVERYRLLGYENRAVADADFRNDKVDAGEIGSGHQVVALYEIVRRNAPDPTAALATVRVRYKDPHPQGVADRNEETPAHEIERSIQARQAVGAYAQTSAGYRRAVLVAQFAEFLRRSIHARNDSLDRLIEEGGKLAGELEDKEFDEFLDMARKSRDLVLAELHRRDWFDDCADLIRHNCYLRQQVDELSRRFGNERKLDELQRQMGELQRRLDELRRRLEDAQYKFDPDLVPRLQQENLELQRQVIELLEKLRAEGK